MNDITVVVCAEEQRAEAAVAAAKDAIITALDSDNGVSGLDGSHVRFLDCPGLVGLVCAAIRYRGGKQSLLFALTDSGRFCPKPIGIGVSSMSEVYLAFI